MARDPRCLPQLCFILQDGKDAEHLHPHKAFKYFSVLAALSLRAGFSKCVGECWFLVILTFDFGPPCFFFLSAKRLGVRGCDTSPRGSCCVCRGTRGSSAVTWAETGFDARASRVKNQPEKHKQGSPDSPSSCSVQQQSDGHGPGLL